MLTTQPNSFYLQRVSFLVVLWAFAACVLSNWQKCFLDLHVFPEVAAQLQESGVCASDVMSRNVKTASAPSVIVDVRRSLLQVEPCKAAGPDNIPGRVLKDCISYLRYYLKFLTSHSFKQRYHHVLNMPPLSPFQRLQQFRAWMTIVQ